MLSLAAPTPARWAEAALARLDELLVDHAHCEKKAAGMAVQLLFRYPRAAWLQEPLARLAREELLHFEQLLALLGGRGIALRPLRPSPYAGRLRRAGRAEEPGLLVDALLCSALIEARSCERFQLLGEAVPDPGLARFYRGLVAAEARHHGIYVDLACRAAPPAAVRERLAELAAFEAAVLAELPPLARMHGGA